MNPPEKFVEMTCQEYLDKYALRIKRLVKETVDLMEKHGALEPFMQSYLAKELLLAATGTPKVAVTAIDDAFVTADCFLWEVAEKLPKHDVLRLRRRMAYLRTLRVNTAITDLWD